MTRAFVALCASSLMTVATAQQPAFKSGVDAVRVDVGVTRGGRAVTGLTTANFELRDSGVPQQIAALSVEDAPLDLVFVLDTSFSVRGAALQHLKEAAHAAVASLRASDRAALLTFSHLLERHVPLSGDSDAIDRAIDRLDADGATALNDAAFAAIALPSDAERRKLVVLFTDGFDTASWLSPLAVIERAHRSDVVVDAVLLDQPVLGSPQRGLRDGSALPGQRRRWFLEEPQLFRQEFVWALADETGGDVVIANRSGDLSGAFVRIISAFRTRYVLSYSPASVPLSGWHPIDVQLKGAKGNVRARRGYAR
jgi:Ca-activated chloride channel homolog